MSVEHILLNRDFSKLKEVFGQPKTLVENYQRDSELIIEVGNYKSCSPCTCCPNPSLDVVYFTINGVDKPNKQITLNFTVVSEEKWSVEVRFLALETTLTLDYRYRILSVHSVNHSIHHTDNHLLTSMMNNLEPLKQLSKDFLEALFLKELEFSE